MSFNYLLDDFPTEIGDHKINHDTITCLRIINVLNDDDMGNHEKVFISLLLFYEDKNVLEKVAINELFDNMSFFLNCFEEKDNETNTENIETNSNKKPSFDIIYDAKYVYSAFLTMNEPIDLKTDYIHWFKFKALLDEISDKSKLSKIINYRQIDLNEVPKEQKQFYLKMQELYKLPEKIDDEIIKQKDEFLAKLGG